MNRSRAELKGFFKKNALPTQSNFEDFIDSVFNQNDDGLAKLPNDPLTINATGTEESLLRFSRVDAAGSKPAWLVKQNPTGARAAGLLFQDVAGGGNVLFLQSGNGNVGIGTTSPNGRLSISESAGTPASPNAGTLVLDHGNNGGASSIVFRSAVNAGNDFGYIQYQDTAVVGGVGESARLIIGTSNDPNDHLLLLPSGSVGIGTQNPGAKLEIAGGGGQSIDLLVNGRLKSNSNDGGMWIAGDRFVGGTGNQIGFYTGGAWRLLVTPEGNVNIAGAQLTIGAWTLEADATHLYIKNGGLIIARFSTGADRFNAFQTPNNRGIGPYFYFNNGGNFGVGSFGVGGQSPPP